MRVFDLKTLIKECIQEVFEEEFGEEGWMQAVNVREKDEDSSDSDE